MPFNRRECLTLVAGGMAAGVLLSTPMAQAATRPKIKAIAFDWALANYAARERPRIKRSRAS
jgi:hypothetical protein